MGHLPPPVAGLLLLLLCVLPAWAHPDAPSPRQALLEPLLKFGRRDLDTADLPAMLAKKRVRALVTYSRTDFFISPGGRPRGLMRELAEEYRRHLDTGRKDAVQVTFVPVLPDEALPALLNGLGDVIARELPVTPEDEALVAFTRPLHEDVRAVLVTRAGEPPLAGLEGLSGREVHVPPDSSQARLLERINLLFARHGLPPVRVRETAATMGVENLLELLAGGFLDNVVCDDHVAELWAPVFGKLQAHTAVPLSAGGRTAWAVRKDNPGLLADLNAFLARARTGEAARRKRFAAAYANARFLSDPFLLRDKRRLLPSFRKYAADYGFDWLTAMAQGFQESALDNSARSPDGALGIMQVLPATARAMGIPDVGPETANIRAGLKYMRRLRTRYFNDSSLSPEIRLHFTLAAYNAGPTRVLKLRAMAQEAGLNPNIWYGNVERVALHTLGQEPVNYVRGVENAALAYRLALERSRARPARNP